MEKDIAPLSTRAMPVNTKATLDGKWTAFKIDIDPVAKPRQTQQDKFMKRPPVLRYRAFAEELSYKVRGLPVSYIDTIIFRIAMPKSWSRKRREQMLGMAHEAKPDFDNLAKAFYDALLKNDSAVWNVRLIKVWDYKGSIEVRCRQELYPPIL